MDATQLRDALVAAFQAGQVSGIDSAGVVQPEGDEEAVLGLTADGTDYFLVIQSA